MGARDVAGNLAGLAIAWWGIWYFFFYEPDKRADTPAPAVSVVSSPAAAPAPDTNSLAPDDQKSFQAVIASAREKYRAGTTDFQKGATRPARAEALCKLRKDAQVKDWIGTVTKLTTNSDGKGVISIQIGDDVYTKTWNNSVSDTSNHTLIEPSSKVFAQLATLKVGQAVKFSGQLFKNKVDCFREASLTLDGSMDEPEFIMKFSDISPL